MANTTVHRKHDAQSLTLQQLSMSLSRTPLIRRMGIGELLLVVGASCLAVDAFSPPCPTFSAIRPRSLARGLECRRIPLRPSTGTGCLADLEPRRLAALNQQKKQAPDFIVEDAKVAEKRLSEQQ
eukprot:1324765-Rhodomonas_salina.1